MLSGPRNIFGPHLLLVAFMVLFVIGGPGSPRADQLANQERALNMILNAADRLCGIVSDRGQMSNSQVQVEVRAQLNWLARQLAEAGIDGSLNIENESYVNVVRGDLSSTMHNSQQCKLTVLERLQGSILK